LGWASSVFFSDYRKIKNINGLDSYFFVRFLRMMVRLMLPIWLVSWAVLLPLTSVNTSVAGDSGLDMFIFGNIGTTDQDRYSAHLILTWIFTSKLQALRPYADSLTYLTCIVWIWWNIQHEMAHYVRVRQHYLVSSSHSSTAQACSVLVTGIPPKYLSESALTRLFSHLPGGVRKVWINRDLGDMPDLYNQRLEACQMLESAETSLLNTAIKRNNKKLKKAAKSGDGGKNSSNPELTEPASDPETRKTPIEELVPKAKRPTHRLPLFSWMPFSIPLLGKKVDSIEWARERVHELNTELAQRRQILARDIAQTTTAEAQTTTRTHNIGAGKLNIAIPAVGTRAVVNFADQTYPPANGAFILFNEQIAAHMAAQMLIHHEAYRMSDSLKYVEVAPEDVIWDNLVMNPYERRIRLVLSWSATIGLIIVWAIPGKRHLNPNATNGLELKQNSSGVCRRRFEYPFPVHDIPLACVALQNPSNSYQHHPGFPPCSTACDPLHVSPDSVADIGTLGRHPSADSRGAHLNGSLLPIPSYCALHLVVPREALLINMTERLFGCLSLVRYYCFFA
jgi:hypothetical protein